SVAVRLMGSMVSPSYGLVDDPGDFDFLAEALPGGVFGVVEQFDPVPGPRLEVRVAFDDSGGDEPVDVLGVEPADELWRGEHVLLLLWLWFWRVEQVPGLRVVVVLDRDVDVVGVGAGAGVGPPLPRLAVGPVVGGEDPAVVDHIPDAGVSAGSERFGDRHAVCW